MENPRPSRHTAKAEGMGRRDGERVSVMVMKRGRRHEELREKQAEAEGHDKAQDGLEGPEA